MHEYKQTDISQCLQGRRLVFIGDSTVRQVFWAVAKKMGRHSSEEEPPDAFELGHKAEDIEFESNGVRAKFIWDPWLNSTGLEQELEKYEAQPPTDGREDESAALILVGAPGLWYAGHGQANYFQDFRTSIDRVIPHMDHAPTENDTGRTERHRPFDNPANLLLLSPVQDPVYQALSPAAKATLTFPKIHMMNEYLKQASSHSSADVIWSYSLMTGMGDEGYTADGIHVVQSLAGLKADILLNLRCNGNAATRGYPYNRTCCNNYKRPNVIQLATLVIGLFVLPALVFLRRKHLLKPGSSIPPTDVCNATAILALILCFCFFADRTQLFEKVHIQFSRGVFGGACVAMVVAGVLSVKQSQRPTVTHDEQESIPDDVFLSHDQIDEWKGFAGVFILICHYTGTSELIWLYMITRILVAVYLFYTAYEYALSSLITLDYSIQFATTVLVRLNLLSSILPFMMRTNNAFYYLPLLTSFWFVVNYLTLKIGARHNSNLNFLFAKIILSAMFTTALMKIPGLSELISAALQHTCGIAWDVASWRSTTSLDMYIPYVGILFAILCHRLSLLDSTSQFSSHPIDTLLRFTQTRHALFQNVSILALAILLAIFWGFVRHISERDGYDQWHPYVSWIPILSALALRVSHPYLRAVNSRMFARLGRCSLEIYILHYHIWLAGDSSGLLKIGLWNGWVESAILALIFLWLSCHTAQASQGLTAWIVCHDVLTEKGESECPQEEDRDALQMSLGAENEARSVATIRGRYRAGLLAEAVNRFKGSLNWTLMAILGLLWVGNWVYR
jgi:hypothetical protein